MHRIDLQFAREKHNHLMKTSRTEQLLREIRQKKRIRIIPLKAAEKPEKTQTIVAASEARPA